MGGGGGGGGGVVTGGSTWAIICAGTSTSGVLFISPCIRAQSTAPWAANTRAATRTDRGAEGRGATGELMWAV